MIKMNNYRNIIGLFIFFVCVTGTSAGQAQDHTQEYDFTNSLTSLHESARLVFEDNLRLRSENEMYRQKIQEMYQVLEVYQKENQQLAQKEEAQTKLVTNPVEDKLKMLEQKLQASNQANTDVQAQIQAYQQKQDVVKAQIEKLKKEIQTVSARKNQNPSQHEEMFQQRRDQLIEKIHNVEKQLKRKEFDLNHLTRKMAHEDQAMKKLYEKKAYAQSQLAAAEKEMALVSADEETYEQLIAKIDKDTQAKADQLDAQLVNLEKKKEKLTSVLKTVREKINDHPTILEYDLGAAAYLKDNLKIMERENTALREELLSYEKNQRKRQ